MGGHQTTIVDLLRALGQGLITEQEALRRLRDEPTDPGGQP